MKKPAIPSSLILRIVFGVGISILLALGLQAGYSLYINQGSGIFRQLTTLGKAGEIAFVFFSFIGAVTWLINLLPFGKPSIENKRNWLTFAATALIVYAIALIIFIYTSTLRIILFSWAVPLVLLGLIVLTKLPENDFCLKCLKPLDYKDLLLGVVLFILVSALQQFKQAAPIEPFWRGLYYGIAVFNGGIFVLTCWFLHKQIPNWLKLTGWNSFRNRYRLIHVAIITFLVLATTYLVFWKDPDGIAFGTIFRLEMILLGGLLFGFALENRKFISISSIFTGIGIIGVILLASSYLSKVTTYPFSLSWSEGNRFYDYSLIFGKSLYDYSGQLNPNYFQPIRYGLWGLPFLIPGLPIWVHRLWNALLYIVPSLWLGWLLGKNSSSIVQRIAFTCWTALLLNMGPVYPTLTISVLIIILFKNRNRWIYYLALIAASIFAGLSRFTWVIATGAWAGLIDLMEMYPLRTGVFWKRLLPTVGMILLGALPGMLVSWPTVFSPQNSYFTSQALLWYRLLPSATYPLGILPGTILAVLPALLLIAVNIRTKQPLLDLWQGLASILVLIGTFAAGLVASSKIGGGSNLHNMDMLFVVLILLFSYLFSLESFQKDERPSSRYSFNAALLLVLMLLPAWAATWGVRTLTLPKADTIKQTLNKIKSEIANVDSKSEILFLDQRQLLTFHTIQGVPLVADYEKKYVMDMAMAGNKPYFDGFYKDIGQKRFALIISAPVNQAIKTEDDSFGEENNIWVNAVSLPLLESYQPIYLDKRNNIQLLIPRP